jgi:hypothetical protein
MDVEDNILFLNDSRNLINNNGNSNDSSNEQ